jgi:hypothetical protein
MKAKKIRTIEDFAELKVGQKVNILRRDKSGVNWYYAGNVLDEGYSTSKSNPTLVAVKNEKVIEQQVLLLEKPKLRRSIAGVFMTRAIAPTEEKYSMYKQILGEAQ